MTNSDHFHPYVVRFWIDYHDKALDAALKAFNHQGIKSLEYFENALYIQSFADHYLHDSFSAGHMGFNRAASSNAASNAFHDNWNETGRCMMNGLGDQWKMFGDGKLSASIGGKSYLDTAAGESVGQFLKAYISGKRSLNDEIKTKKRLPHIANTPSVTFFGQLLDKDGCFSDIKLDNLNQTYNPAYASITLDVWVFSYLQSSAKTVNVLGTVIGGSINDDGLNVYIPLRLYVGIGAASIDDGKDFNNFAFDAGYIIPLFNSNDGLLTHEISLGATSIYKSDWTQTMLLRNISYRLNFELGKYYFRSQIGLANGGAINNPNRGMFDPIDANNDYTYYVSLGIGDVRKAAGGGPKKY